MRHLLLILTLLAPLPLQADEPPTKYQRLFAEQCDELLRTSIKRPYGVAWPDESDTDDSTPNQPRKGQIKPVPVSLEPAATPAAGLILLYASDLLAQPRYAQASRDVARAIAASQQPSGKLPSVALFGPTSPAGHEPISPLPDRASTRASLALFLNLVETDPPKPDQPRKDDPISRAASRASSWLVKQQAESGAWPILYPPDAAPKDATRIIRLDTSDTRDNVLAMLLAYEIMGDAFHRRSAEKTVEWLFKARTGASAPVGAGLWQPAYTPAAMTIDHLAEFPPSLDLLASRQSIQTVFSTYIVLGDGQRIQAASLASKSIQDLLKTDEGKWHPRYTFKGEPLLSGPSTKPTFEPEQPAQKTLASDPSLPPLTQIIATAQQIGRDQSRQRLAGGLTLKTALAATLSGLSDGNLPLDFPITPEEVPQYLKRLEDAPSAVAEKPTDFKPKCRGVWQLYLRARIEKRFGV